MFLNIIFMLFTRPTKLLWTRAQSDNMRYKAVWLPELKCLQACRLALIDMPLGLSNSDNKNNNYNTNVVNSISHNNNNSTWEITLTACLCWSVELLVSIVEHMKWSESKKLGGFVFACCLALVPSLPILVLWYRVH